MPCRSHAPDQQGSTLLLRMRTNAATARQQPAPQQAVYGLDIHAEDTQARAAGTRQDTAGYLEASSMGLHKWPGLRSRRSSG